MSKDGPKSLRDLLGDQQSVLHALASEARARVALAGAVRAALPPELAPRVLSANLRDDGTLSIAAAGPEWATRLRFESDAILARVRRDHPGAARVRIRVQGTPGGA